MSKKFGAPPKREPKPGERFQLGVRVTPETKRRLDAAAERSGRSQSQEAELRLERSFDRQDLLPEVLVLAYGRHLAGILMMLAVAMDDLGKLQIDARGSRRRADSLLADSPWIGDPIAYDSALEAAVALLIALRPPSDSTILVQQGDEERSERLLTDFVRAVRRGDAKHPFSKAPSGRQYFSFSVEPSRDTWTMYSLLGPIARRARDPNLTRARRLLSPNKGAASTVSQGPVVTKTEPKA
jgi:TraY domain